LKSVDETFRKNVESNVFSRKMLIQLFSGKCWLKNVGSTFSLKMLQHFLKNVEIFSNARAGGKIKRRLFRWALVGWKFASLSTFR
jgi:hypothetical protein